MGQDKNLINLNEVRKKGNIETPKQKRPFKNSKNKKAIEITEAKSFRMISKIEPQKRKGRYNVYVNDEFAFGVDEDVLIHYELKKGLHITQEFQNTIESEDSFYKAYEKTLNYLSHSLRTEKQISDYLFENEIGHFKDRIIEKLKKSKLLDDLNYAETFVRSKANTNQKGPRNIEQDLKQKGIGDDDIMTALDEYPEEEQLENAIELAEKKWSRTKNSSEFETIQKTKNYLINKGYSFEIADQALAAFDTSKDTEDEYQDLVKQAEKAHRRYARKHEGYQLDQRLRKFMYSKGFPNELINRYFDEREMN